MEIFENETELVKKIISEKPKFWEYKLTVELLKTKFKQLENKFKELEEGKIFTKFIRLDSFNYTEQIISKYNELVNILDIMPKIITEDIPKSWGAPGVSGNSIEIKEVTDRLVAICQAAFDWEREINSFIAPEKFEYTTFLLKGSAKSMFNSVKDFPTKVEAVFLDENPGTSMVDIVIKFNVVDVMKNISKALEEIKKISENPV